MVPCATAAVALPTRSRTGTTAVTHVLNLAILMSSLPQLTGRNTEGTTRGSRGRDAREGTQLDGIRSREFPLTRKLIYKGQATRQVGGLAATTPEGGVASQIRTGDQVVEAEDNAPVIVLAAAWPATPRHRRP